VVQRGASSSHAGFEHREQSLGDTRDVSARGGYGIRETENWGSTPDFSGRGPKNWRRSDAAIAEDVNQRLTDHPEIDATDIEVQVSDCEVTLSGAIEHRSAKRLAEEVAESVPGVIDVHNRLRVMSSVGKRQG
jgi:osmotically-inducible protein OsmY